jgi:hypothetical protein
MFEFCPEGEEGTALFKALFLTRLPAEVRAHVESEGQQFLKELAARADQHEHLPWVLLGLRATPKERPEVSTAEAVVWEAPDRGRSNRA